MSTASVPSGSGVDDRSLRSRLGFGNTFLAALSPAGQALGLRRPLRPPVLADGVPGILRFQPAPAEPRPEGAVAAIPYAGRRSKLVLLALALLTLSACRQDMHDQPRYRPLAASNFFADGRAARPLVPGTIPRGHLRADSRYYRGRDGRELVVEMPVKVTRELLLRGQDRYDIFCAPCHGRIGDGEGMVVQRGFRHPPSFHQERLHSQPVGHYYDVISNGFGAMASYASRIPVSDRWAIVAYVRALQLSQNATIEDVPASERAQLQQEGGQRP